MEVDQKIILYSDIKSREVIEIMDRETYISMSIESSISQHSDLYRVELYDLIMGNTDVATKEHLLFLLEKMGRPNELRPSLKDKRDTLIKLTNFMAFYDIFFKFNVPVTKLRESEKKKIIEWLAFLEPENVLEENLKSEFDAATLSVKDGLENKGEAYKELYHNINKNVLSLNKK